jgi:S-adenosylmethionine hydrolase
VAARPITFLSDYGNTDEFAGVCRAVIAKISPESAVIDLTHAIPRHDIARGAGALGRALPFTPPGVHLAVVDPGVGTVRRPVAVRVAEEDRVLVGPDNGLLSPAISTLGGALEAADLTGSTFARASVAATFHGRDLFAPVAAHLAKGASVAEAGEPIEPESLFVVTPVEPVVEPGRLLAQVADIDGFGNAALGASGQDLDLAGAGLPDAPTSVRLTAPDGGDGAARAASATPPATIEIAGRKHHATRGRAFADAAEGGLLVYVDSSNRVALAVNRGSAAASLGVEPGDEVAVLLT